VPDQVLTGMDPDPDRYFGVGLAIRIDSLGREWLLIAVDAERVAEKRAAYDVMVEDLFGVEPGERLEAAWVEPDNAGQVELGVAMSWNKWNCTGGGWYLFEPEDDPLFDVAAPMNSRQRKMMFLATDDPDKEYGAYCSGVMVDEDTILTAAHCVNNLPEDQYWCSMGNLDIHSIPVGVYPSCHQGDAVVIAPGWTGSTSFSNDYALVHLVDGPGKGWMPLSSVGDDITESPDYVRGYPRRGQDCLSNTVFNSLLTTDDDFVGRIMMGADGYVQTVLPDYVKWDTGAARGISGAPHFYCPSGYCGAGHWITGVTAYSLLDSCPGTGNPEVCPTGATTGPRAAAIRDWVRANL